MPADVQYTASLDDREVLAALDNIDRNLVILARSAQTHFQKMEDIGEKSLKQLGREAEKAGTKSKRAFDVTGKGAKNVGAQIGVVSGIVQELTRRFINMAEKAARAFIEIAKGGIELNKSLELLEIRLTAILSGNQDAARAFLEQARAVANELKIDYLELAELSTAILPSAKDLEESSKLAGRAILLARSLGVNADFARRAIIEALAGQYVSIRRILNLSSAQVEEIQKLEPAIGRAAAISQVLGDQLEAIGFDADAIADSFTGVFSLIQSQAKQVQEIFAKPIFEELKNQAQAFLELFEEHKEDIEIVATAFGQMAADIVELIGSNLVDFLESIDYRQLEKAADAMAELVANANALIRILSQGDVNDTLELTVGIIERMAGALRTAAQLAAVFNAEMARRQAIEESLLEQGKKFDVFLSQASAEDRAKGQQAYNDSIADSVQIFKELDAQLEEVNQRSEERREVTEDNTEAALADAQATLTEAAALEELEQAASDAAEAQEKIDERREKLSTEAQRRLTEILLDAERERLEDAIDAAEKREDLARENAQRIEDIYRKHQQEIADAARDLTRDEEDIYRRYARDRAEIERDSANERVDIETEFRRELQRIQARFNESAAEAERNNDAQAFLAAVRQRDREVEEAKRGRQERLEDASRRAAEQRENLKQQLQYEIEDAKIANQRKLEDLRLRLERELEEQRLNYQRELEEQAISEQRKAEERQRALDQELEDYRRKEAERLADLKVSLKEEYETVKKYTDLQTEYYNQKWQQAAEQVRRALSNVFSGSTSGSSGLTGNQMALGVQEGGPVEAGRPYIVGERGPELFIPAMSGTVLPNSAINLPAAVGATTVSNVSTTVAPTFNVAEDLFNNPVAVRRLQNLVMGVLVEAL